MEWDQRHANTAVAVSLTDADHVVGGVAVACPAVGPLWPAGAISVGWSAAAAGDAVPRGGVVAAVLLLVGKPPEAFRALRVPHMVAFPTVGALGCSGVICLVTGDALLCLVRHAADTAPDDVHTSCLEVVEVLALVTPHRFSLVGAQGVFALVAKVQLGGRLSHNDQ